METLSPSLANVRTTVPSRVARALTGSSAWIVPVRVTVLVMSARPTGIVICPKEPPGSMPSLVCSSCAAGKNANFTRETAMTTHARTFTMSSTCAVRVLCATSVSFDER